MMAFFEFDYLTAVVAAAAKLQQFLPGADYYTQTGPGTP